MAAPKCRRREWFNNNRGKIINELGCTCGNCQKVMSSEDVHIHHIVPISLGGSNNKGNLCILCHECHAKAHGKDPKRWTGWKSSQKAGIERAKKAGKYTGRKKDVEKRRVVVELLEKGHSVRKTAELAGCSTYLVQEVKRERRKAD